MYPGSPQPIPPPSLLTPPSPSPTHPIPSPQTYSEGGNKTQYSSTKPGSFKFKDPFADFFKYIDYREEIYVQRLREAVAIKSVSAWPDHRPEIMKMMSWCQGWIDKLGGESELYANPLKEQKLDDGTTIPLPPILLGQFGNDPKKKVRTERGHLQFHPTCC